MSAYYDGRTVSLRNNTQGLWAESRVPGTLDEMLDDVGTRYSLPVSIADVIDSLPYEACIGRDTKGGVVGRETIDGVECAHLAYVDHLVDVEIWIPSSGQPLPRRVELVYKQAPGEPRVRIDFTSRDLASRIAGDAFTLHSGEASRQVAFEQLVTSMLAMEERR